MSGLYSCRTARISGNTKGTQRNRLIVHSKLTVGVNVGVKGCLSSHVPVTSVPGTSPTLVQWLLQLAPDPGEEQNNPLMTGTSSSTSCPDAHVLESFDWTTSTNTASLLSGPHIKDYCWITNTCCTFNTFTALNELHLNDCHFYKTACQQHF